MQSYSLYITINTICNMYSSQTYAQATYANTAKFNKNVFVNVQNNINTATSIAWFLSYNIKNTTQLTTQILKLISASISTTIQIQQVINSSKVILDKISNQIALSSLTAWRLFYNIKQNINTAINISINAFRVITNQLNIRPAITEIKLKIDTISQQINITAYIHKLTQVNKTITTYISDTTKIGIIKTIQNQVILSTAIKSLKQIVETLVNSIVLTVNISELKFNWYKIKHQINLTGYARALFNGIEYWGNKFKDNIKQWINKFNDKTDTWYNKFKDRP